MKLIVQLDVPDQDRSVDMLEGMKRALISVAGIMTGATIGQQYPIRSERGTYVGFYHVVDDNG